MQIWCEIWKNVISTIVIIHIDVGRDVRKQATTESNYLQKGKDKFNKTKLFWRGLKFDIKMDFNFYYLRGLQ